MFYLITSKNFNLNTWSQIMHNNKVNALRDKWSFPSYKYTQLQLKESELKEQLSVIDSLIEKMQKNNESNQDDNLPTFPS